MTDIQRSALRKQFAALTAPNSRALVAWFEEQSEPEQKRILSLVHAGAALKLPGASAGMWLEAVYSMARATHCALAAAGIED